MKFEDIYLDLEPSQLIEILHNTIENMYSDEIADGNFQVPKKVTQQLRESIAKAYSISNILKNKMETEELLKEESDNN